MSSRFAFLGTPKWLGFIAGAIVIAIVCTMLGQWQWNRYQARAADIALVQANYDTAPEQLTSFIPQVDSELDPDDEWRQVALQGEYVGQAFVIPQRGSGGNPADHVGGVFLADMDDGQQWAIVVNRGWYRTDSFTDHTSAQQLPSGEVDLVVRLRPAELPSERDLGEGQLHRLNPAQAVEVVTDDQGLGDPYATGFYGQLVSEQQAGSDVVPAELTPAQRPEANLGSHLSYALQWWVFAIGILAALVMFARRESRGAYAPVRRRRSEDDEDDFIDTQLQASATSSA